MTPSTLQIINADKRPLTFHILRKGDFFGDDDTSLYTNEEPSIEIFEAAGFEEETEVLGFFTGIRCLVSEVFVGAQNTKSQFAENMALWSISTENMIVIQKWLQEGLTEFEQCYIQNLPLVLPPSSSISPSTPMFTGEATAELPIQSCALNEATPPPSFTSEQLEQALHALNLAENAEQTWKQGQVDIRIHILKAKQELLQAIALLHQNIN